ncbi:MAG: N,N-dimethylformamidase beta subunit family domain-containing protein [Trueperaceae bacterium]
MLIGYVSDERYLALHDVNVEFLRGDESVARVRSSPRGAIYADLPNGDYTVELARDGNGAKSVSLSLPLPEAHQFRLLSDSLYGYMWPKWVRSGESAEYCIHASEECRVSLWRYGLEKEFVRLINWHGEHGPRANVQVVPDGDYTQAGVQWNRVGYDSKHHSLRITAPERSGLYYIHLEGRSGAFTALPWVVAPRSPQARIAVLAATNTWNAYNNFGGRSNYIHPDRLPDRPTMNARLELDRYRPGYNAYGHPNDSYLPLSFMRPEPGNFVPLEDRITDAIRGRNECALSPAEWRLLGWLEREGFDYDLWAEAHLHHGQLDLDEYQILMISVHPEYWSAEMYRQVKNWVIERGGRLMYLGGNGIDGPVEFLDESTLRFLNHVPEDASLQPGEIFRNRFTQAVESPAQLLGVVYDDRGIMTAAPYRVLDDQHWAFSGSGLHNGDLFGVTSLGERISGGASGHETDKVSPLFSPAGVEVLAKGTNPDDGGADMICYRSASGGRVFSTGSITYVGSLLVDDPLSKVTSNVLNRFLD